MIFSISAKTQHLFKVIEDETKKNCEIIEHREFVNNLIEKINEELSIQNKHYEDYDNLFCEHLKCPNLMNDDDNFLSIINKKDKCQDIIISLESKIIMLNNLLSAYETLNSNEK